MAAPLSSQENLTEAPPVAAGINKAPSLTSGHVSSAEKSSVSAQHSLGANQSSSKAAVEAPTISGLTASGVQGACKQSKKIKKNKKNKKAKKEYQVIQETPYRVVSQPKGHNIVFPPRERGSVCFACGCAGDEALIPCSRATCNVAVHLSCLEKLPSGGCNKLFLTRGGSDEFTCPLHHCATCYNNARRTTCANGTLEQCSQCETAWHADCRPAGCETVNGDTICPRHRSFPAEPPLHTNHCVLCNKIDPQRKVVHCKRCLRSVHFECIKNEDQSLTQDSEEYRAVALCFWCIAGDYPVVDQPCMGRQGNRCWYPCKIVADEEYPVQSDPNLGKLGYVAVQWLQWKGKLYHSVLPYNRLVAMTEKDFFFVNTSGHDDYANCVDSWKELQEELKNTLFTPITISKAIKKASAKPDTIKHLKTNMLKGLDRKLLPKKPVVTMCDCAKGIKDRCGPGSDCTNRSEGMECPKACAEIGGGCNNRFITTGQTKQLEVFLTDGGVRGHGLRTKEPIRKDEFIGEYLGEVITEAEMQKRRAALSVYGVGAKFYFMSYAKGLYLDAQFKGNAMRFANHSCEPNAELVKVWSNGPYPHLLLKGLKNIDADGEITFDYTWDDSRCLCGTESCTGVMSMKGKTTKTTKSATVTKSATATKFMADEQQPSTSKASASVPIKRKAPAQTIGPQPSKRSKMTS